MRASALPLTTKNVFFRHLFPSNVYCSFLRYLFHWGALGQRVTSFQFFCQLTRFPGMRTGKMKYCFFRAR
jgi:hypothetical protein